MFNLKIVLCLISVNFFKNEKYVLSIDKDSISLPYIDISDIDNMQQNIHSYIQSMFLNIKYNDISRVRFVSFNDNKVKSLFPDDKNTIHVQYGTTIPNLETTPEYHWVVFDYMDTKLQKELSIISNTLQHVI